MEPFWDEFNEEHEKTHLFEVETKPMQMVSSISQRKRNGIFSNI